MGARNAARTVTFVIQGLDVSIRHAIVTDAEQIVALGRGLDRDQLATTDSFRLLLERPAPPLTERLVAVTAGRLLAWAPSGIYASRVGWFWVGVEHGYRRRGVGAFLYDQIENRLRRAGATRVDTTPSDDDGRAFLLARGFAVGNIVRNSEVDPRTVSARPPRTDARPVSLARALGYADALFRLCSEARQDVPADSPLTPWTFDEWRAETIDSPLIDVDASVVLLEHDEPVALAWLYSDREGQRAETLMAATRRDRRGRGLATAAKIESTRLAAKLGITRIVTSNDLDNHPMLAINDRLGFTPTAIVASFSKNLSHG